MQGARRCVLLVALLVTLGLTAPAPSHLLALPSAGAGLDADLQPLLTLLGLLAWCGTGWLVLVAGLVQAGALPGHVGRCSRWAARRVAPAAVRRALQIALGLTLVTGTAAALTGPASASTTPTPYGPVPTLDWPGSPHAGSVDPVAAPTVPRASRAPATTPAHEQPVVVSPGDSLWSLARSELGPQASPARVAQAWPRWWEANRAVIGDDPSLLTPGQHLTPPDPPA